MTSDVHRFLVVEDDAEMAMELGHLIEAMGFEHVHVDSRAAALEQIKQQDFCLILLDLEIKAKPKSISLTQSGFTLLREVCKRYPRNGEESSLPVIIVSGHAKDDENIIDAMRIGAIDVVHKPLRSDLNQLPLEKKIDKALRFSGRDNHALCLELRGMTKRPPSNPKDTSETISLVVTGKIVKQRTEIVINGTTVTLTEASLLRLLRLACARISGAEWVHKSDLGAEEEQGFKGISRLREQLAPGLPGGQDIVENNHHGSYRLSSTVKVEEIAFEVLATSDSAVIVQVADEIKKVWKD